MEPTPSFESPELAGLNLPAWEFHGHWKQDLFAAYFWHSCFDADTLHHAGLDLPEIGYLVFKEGHYLVNRDITALLREGVVTSLAAGDLSIWHALNQQSEEAQAVAIALADQKHSPLTTDSWEQGLRMANRLTLYWALAAGHLCVIADELLAEGVANEGLSPEAAQAIIPPLRTPLFAERTTLLGFKREFEQGSIAFTTEALAEHHDLHEELANYADRFAWMEIASWTGSPMTLGRLVKLIESTDEPQHSTETRDISPKLKGILTFFEIAGLLRQASAECFMKLSFSYMKPLEEYAMSLGTTYKELLRLTPVEVLEGLNGNLTRDDLLERIARRADGNWITLSVNGNGLVIESAEDVAALTKAKVPQANGATLIKGQTGNPGTATGRVKVIMNTEDFGKMEPGDILVSTMTTPDFVILMQQAAAIVTDIGGILCHAAIVSREIGKPCVIGTKVATKTLQDGDLVEVDATRGTVTKL